MYNHRSGSRFSYKNRSPGGFGRRNFSSGRKNYFQGSKLSDSVFVKKASLEAKITEEALKLKYEELELNITLKENIKTHGYISLTDIQEKTIKNILAGSDVIGVANTGTGKTAAFLVPLLDMIARDDSKGALVVVPTRELAAQINQEFKLLSRNMRIYSALCTGGSFIRDQIYQIQRNPHFVIGTPGRMKDLIDRKVLKPENYNTVVLDEVDRMLDMGFIADIKYIFEKLPEKHQSLFFSATVSREIDVLINSFMKEPIRVSVKKQETIASVEQDVVRVGLESNKLTVLAEMLEKDEFSKVLIFGRTKRGVERLANDLYKKGFKVGSIHGDKPQAKRNQAIRLFKDDVINILVATDVAARGLDIMDISHVINYDKPQTYEDYIHRIGRTGRAEKTGVALTFV